MDTRISTKFVSKPENIFMYISKKAGHHGHHGHRGHHYYINQENRPKNWTPQWTPGFQQNLYQNQKIF